MAKRDFLTITDFSRAQLDATLNLAMEMKKRRMDHQPFGGGSAALIFKKPSLRTRVSFEVGVHELGGHPIYITDQEIGLGKRESVHDIAQVLSRYVRLIEIRTFEHDEVVQLARHAKVPVINGLSDLYHPCQVMADIMTIIERKGRIDGLTVAYVGDGNNVSHSWLKAAQRFDFRLRIGTVRENEPDAKIFAEAQAKSKARVQIVWASMGQKHLADQNRERLAGFQINAELLAMAAPQACVLHCLPANRGEEITDEVIDGPQSAVFDEAENRLHIQKALMYQLLTDFGT